MLRSILRGLNPAALVLAGGFVLFLFLPDGLPFLYAGCASSATAGEASAATIESNDPCRVNGTGTALVYANYCTLTPSTTHCTLTAEMVLVITPDCDVRWTHECTGPGGTETCGNPLAGSGPNFNQTVSTTTWCDDADDEIVIRLKAPLSCGCFPELIFHGHADCN